MGGMEMGSGGYQEAQHQQNFSQGARQTLTQKTEQSFPSAAHQSRQRNNNGTVQYGNAMRLQKQAVRAPAPTPPGVGDGSKKKTTSRVGSKENAETTKAKEDVECNVPDHLRSTVMIQNLPK